MSIKVKVSPTSTPDKLLRAIIAATEKEHGEKGNAPTWSYDVEAKTFTHTTGNESQWEDKAYLKPKVVGADTLELAYEPSKNEAPKEDCYGVYHGRFIELLLNRFSTQLDSVEVFKPKRQLKLGIVVSKSRS